MSQRNRLGTHKIPIQEFPRVTSDPPDEQVGDELRVPAAEVTIDRHHIASDAKGGDHAGDVGEGGYRVRE